jgi:hypothetical protein
VLRPIGNQGHMNNTICKLPEGAGGGYYMLWVEWNPGSFRILLLKNGSAWNGHVRLFTTCSLNLICHDSKGIC